MRRRKSSSTLDSVCVVLVTCPSAAAGRKLARGLVSAKLAACVNLVPVASIYRWEGKVEEARETLLVIKTTDRVWPRLREYVRSHHSYSVPEIIALPVSKGHRDYLNWVASSVSGGKKK